MSKHEELVSVIIPSYNRFIFLLQAVSSVLYQTHQNIEVIIVDDCSTQKEYTELLPNVFKNEPRIKIIRCVENMRKVHNTTHAQGMTRNEGLKVAKGEYIALLDDDDFWLFNKLERQLDVIKKFGKEEYKLCSSNTMTGVGLFKSGTYGGKFYSTPFGKKLESDVVESDSVYECVLSDCTNMNYVINSSSLFHSSLLSLAGYQTTEEYEDWKYWKQLLKYTKGLYIDESLVGYDMGHGGGKQYYNPSD